MIELCMIELCIPNTAFPFSFQWIPSPKAVLRPQIGNNMGTGLIYNLSPVLPLEVKIT